MNISMASDDVDAYLLDLVAGRLPALAEAIDQFRDNEDKVANSVAVQIAWLYEDLDCPTFQSLRKIGDALRWMT